MSNVVYSYTFLATGVTPWYPAPPGGCFTVLTGLGSGALSASVNVEVTNDTSGTPTVAIADTIAYSSTGNGSVSKESNPQAAYWRLNCTSYTGTFTSLKADVNIGNAITSTSGGGGGAVTMASGAVAAGAYAVGSEVDGSNVTMGTTSDAAYAGSGSSSLVAALKGIYNAVVGTLKSNLYVGGTVASATNPIPMYDAYMAPSAVTWTSATTANTAATFNTQGYDTVVVTLVGNAALSGGSTTFEVYDGVTWLPVKAPTIVDYTTVGTVTLTASYSKGFQVPVAGFPQFRVRLVSVLTGSGTQNLIVTVVVSSAPDVSLVTVGLDPSQPLPSGTNTLGAVTAAAGASLALETGGNLATVAARTPALGVAASSASSPVVLASDDAQIGVKATAYSFQSGASGLQGTLSDIALAARGTLGTAGSPASSVSTVQFVADATTSGSITAINSNLNSGVASANSTVQITCNGISTVSVQCSANTWTTSIILQYSNDNTNWINAFQSSNASTGAWAGGAIGSSATGLWQVQVAGFKYFRASANTSGTGSATIVIDASPGSSQLANTTNIQFVGGSTALTTTPTGGTAQALTNAIASASTQTDYNAQAWAAASGNGAAIVDSGGVGGVVSCFVNLTAWTVGSSTGLDIFLQTSLDGGTTYQDIWQCEALTATGTVYIPPIYMLGQKRRMRWVNRTGAATTATVTVTTCKHSLTPPRVQRQWFDRTAGLLAGTAANTSATYDFNGCTVLTALVTIGAATTPATYQWQVSADGTNFANVGTATPAVASSTTPIILNGFAARQARLIVTSGATAQTGTVVALLGT